MTTVAVVADPPVEGVVLTDLVDGGPLSADEAADLYEAMLADVCAAVATSGAELLVNYRPDDQLPDAVTDSEAAIRSVVDDALAEIDDAEDPRYEVQVGSTHSARVGNTVTHLLDTEDVRTAAAVPPTAALLGRQHVDSAAMKLRRSDVVLGPSTDGRLYYAGFAEPVDFADAYAVPEIETIARRARDADLDVDFLPTLPVLDRPSDLATVLSQIGARRTAGRTVPARTTERVVDLGLDVVADGDRPRVVRA